MAATTALMARKPKSLAVVQLRQITTLQGLTAGDLAEKTGIPVGRFYNYFRGHEPNLHDAVRLEKKLGIPVLYWLLDIYRNPIDASDHDLLEEQ